MTRTRIAAFVLIFFLAFTLLVVLATGWYGFRVWTELAPGSWREPTTILAHDGEMFLEVYGGAWRRTEPVVLEELPEHVPAAFLAAEDVRFRRHPGLDPWGIGRAALANLRKGGIAQGGSTITQQLAKTRFLSTERTFTRKGAEAILALLIEARLSKDDILEAYLNDVYLGHDLGRTVVGLDEAALLYFDKSPADLTVAEAALLAGMVRAPNRDNPEEKPEVAKERRDGVLQTMLDREWITEEEFEEAKEVRVRFRRGSLASLPHRYWIEALRSELIDHIGERRLNGGGLKIHAAVDPAMQKAAENAVRTGTRRLTSRYRWLRRDEPLQGAILSVDPASGGVRALVGGVDWSKSQFDRTRRMKRQPGSAAKPFAYAAALAERTITPASIVLDEPVEIELSRNDIWRPHNYDERTRGEVTVREAFEKSLNLPIVRVVDEVGVRRVKNVFEDARVGTELSDTPAIALGVDEVSMRDLVGAYTIFPNLGRRAAPHLIDRVESRSGRTIYEFRAKNRKVLDPDVAYLVHSLMRGVVQRGTASSLRRSDLGHVAGKTGTTNDYRDAWFVGYAPDLLTASWVGFDDGTPLRISSAEAALPMWASYMSAVSHDRGEIQAPEGVSLVAIQPSSGLLWSSGCGARLDEVFLAGTEPDERCRGRVAQPPLFVEFEEPPIISAEKFREWVADAPGVRDIQIIVPGDEGVDDDPDILSPEERAEVDRQLREALERTRGARPPADRDDDDEDEPETLDARERARDAAEEAREREEEQREPGPERNERQREREQTERNDDRRRSDRPNEEENNGRRRNDPPGRPPD